MSETIDWSDFQRIDIRVGTIARAEPNASAHKPAITVWIAFGPAVGEKKSSARLTHHYTSERLIGRQVAAVVNFPPRQTGKLRAEVLVLGFPDAGGEVVLIMPDRKIPDGGRLF
jgi:tRNA-binding protein